MSDTTLQYVQHLLTTKPSGKVIVIILVCLLVAAFFAVFITVALPYGISVFIALIYALNAETWMSGHGHPFSYWRAFAKSFMGPFYIHNYYHQAFGTYSLDIHDQELDPRFIKKVEESAPQN